MFIHCPIIWIKDEEGNDIAFPVLDDPKEENNKIDEYDLNTLTGTEILQLIDSGKFGSPIDIVNGFSWCSETYRNGYKRIVRVKSSSVIADELGIYLYKINPITKEETLIEFIPEENNNLK